MLHPQVPFLLWLTLAAAPTWKQVVPGVEYRALPLEGAGLLHAVRLDPEQVELGFALRSKAGGSERTATEWAEQEGLVVAINAGMFQTDHRSNVGRLVDGPHVNHAEYNDYQSVLVFGPKKAGLPRAQVLDLDAPGARELAAQYGSATQNLRLIKAPGVSVWKPNGRAWSEAAIAQDKQGRLLFLFSRSGLEMAKWNELVLAAPLEVVKAFHVEGGPEASLTIHTPELKLELCGSYETGFLEHDRNGSQWAIPNVIGVRKPKAPRRGVTRRRGLLHGKAWSAARS